MMKKGSTHIMYQQKRNAWGPRHSSSLLLCFILLCRSDKSITEKVTPSETLKTKRRPWRYDVPAEKLRCLVSGSQCSDDRPWRITKWRRIAYDDTRVKFNLLFCHKGTELWERAVSRALEVNSIYNKNPEVWLWSSAAESCDIRWLLRTQ